MIREQLAGFQCRPGRQRRAELAHKTRRYLLKVMQGYSPITSILARSRGQWT